MMTRRSLMVAALMSLGSFALGQGEGRKISFRVLSWKGELTELRYLQGEDLEEMHGYDHILSQPYSYRGPAVMKFYGEGAIPAEEAPLAQVAIPPGVKTAILLFVKEGEGYQVRFIRDDEKSLGWGVARFYNTTKEPLGVEVGGRTRKVEAGKQLDLKPELQKGRFFYLRMGRVAEGELLPFHTAYVPLTASQRVLCFLKRREHERMPIEFKRVYDLKRPPVNEGQ